PTTAQLAHSDRVQRTWCWISPDFSLLKTGRGHPGFTSADPDRGQTQVSSLRTPFASRSAGNGLEVSTRGPGRCALTHSYMGIYTHFDATRSHNLRRLQCNRRAATARNTDLPSSGGTSG